MFNLSLKYYNKKIKLQFGPRKARIIFREAARETHDKRVIKKWLLAKPRSFSDLPAFLESSGRKEMQFLEIFSASPSAIKNSSSPTVHTLSFYIKQYIFDKKDILQKWLNKKLTPRESQRF